MKNSILLLFVLYLLFLNCTHSGEKTKDDGIKEIKILEDNNSLYFTVEYRNRLYPAIYDKTEDRLQIMPDVSIPSQGIDGKRIHYGFENDLDGGLPFWPE